MCACAWGGVSVCRLTWPRGGGEGCLASSGVGAPVALARPWLCV